MPRPGPRPYECVKRAWHSDRHQPLRGLIIQQIFRLVHENHCGATKKNREWLEKLPIVVFKSEEIMYSKANSEAAYSNLETLWDRVNEAIDTIVRKEESTETGGGLLPSCVEAALNLGCVPVRTSRSQRNDNPRSYLRARNQESFYLSPNVSNENATEHHSIHIPPHTGNISMFKKTPNVDSPRLVSESNKCLTLDTDKGITSSREKLPGIRSHWCTELGTNNLVNMGSVYPLYYGNFKPEVSQLGFQEPQKSDAIIFGVPIFSSVAKPAEIGSLQNLFPYAADSGITRGTLQSDPKDNKRKESQIGCDLSLRLGRLSGSNSSRENIPGCGTDGVVCRVSQVESLPNFKEFHFFPVKSASAYDPSMMRRVDSNYEVETPNGEEVSRKRKLPVSGDADHEPCFWSHDYISNWYDGQMKRPGL